MRYFTLWGQRFDLENLSPEDFSTIDKIREADKKPSDEEFLTFARRLIRESSQTYTASARVLSGPVGAIYRDLWYRRQIGQAKKFSRPEAERILRNVRTHPGRIVHDAFLDIGESQVEFARQVGVSTAVISKLFQCFRPRTEAEAEKAFSTSTVIEILNRLGITPHGVYFDQPFPGGSDPEELALAPTLRERLLLITVIEGVHRIRTTSKPFADVDKLTRRLARLFNTVDVHFLDALVRSVIDAARDVGDSSGLDVAKLLSVGQGERLFSADTQRSQLLFDRWRASAWAGQQVAALLEEFAGSAETPREDAPVAVRRTPNLGQASWPEIASAEITDATISPVTTALTAMLVDAA
jgi:hypothetical protein